MTAQAELDLVLAALDARRELTDWTVEIVTTRAAWRGRGLAEADGEFLERAITATVHRDLPSGRGTATVRLDPDRSLDAALTRASARAAAAVGPAWRAPPPAAPARVELLDPTLDPGAPAAALAALSAALDDAVGTRAVYDATLAVELVEHELYSQRGQRARWLASALRVEAGFDDDRPRRVTGAARRQGELALAEAVARTEPPPSPHRLAAGTYPVILSAAAILDGDRGLLEAFVAQADPQLERQGLARYRPGRPVTDGATVTIHSDGALPFGWHSAPLGPTGEPVRRFPLVVDGVAGDLALDTRAAALLGRTANGGARGLVVEPGPDELDDPDALVIDRFDWLELDRITGWFRAGFGVARRGGAGASLGAGVLRGDAVALLARARRSRATYASPSYRGPAAWHLGPVAFD